MVSIGGIVSVGGGGGSGGGGSLSGITSINGATGPSVTLAGVSGVSVVPSGNVILIGGEGVSGGGGSDGSGINAINGDTGPNIDFKGVNGAVVSNPSPGCILVDCASISGITSSNQYSASFTNITSGIFNHNLNTLDVVVQVRDDSVPPREILPDDVVYDNINNISLLFNEPQTGRITIIGSGVSCSLSSDQIVDSRRYALLVS